jgi:hypothetical protein
MTTFSDLLARLLRGAFRLLLVLAAGVFVLSFLLAALLVVLGMTLWSLLTGRKPAPVVVFQRMREQSRRYTQGVWPDRPASGDVVDVQATEVDESARPGAGGPAAPVQRLH